MPQHKEAFCLMWYACDCGHRERIWNSRDGVTPFACGCPSCGGTMTHISFHRDEPRLNHKLNPGQKFFRDGTPDEAEKFILYRAEALKNTYPIREDHLNQLISMAREGHPDSEFRKGWPLLDVYMGEE